ncbi:MAG: site-specific DNA-methyltransferase [Lachnospiraceae bacterium]|nr:site-specific DNA-methyltransferase [Lachnospiraceae bacterium]
MDKLRMQTANKADENFKKLADMFPNAVTETIDENGEVVRAIDKDVLMQEISCKVVDGNEERYQFTWPDKKKSVLLANAPINKTLRPCREESVDFDNTENLYIEGDNLEVLKLLQETYLGKIKMIYIDPPYNTGSDFVYDDDFLQNETDYISLSGQTTEEGEKLFQNTETNGRFHTDWLNMIYPRIKLAKDLLTEDGALFISIDDNEVTNLTKMCDEIFGSNNRIALICHKSRASVSNDKIISPNHNIVLFYAKNRVVMEYNRKMIGLDPVLEGFDLNNNDGKGAYRLVPVDGPGGAKKGNPHYEFLGIEGYWRFSKETMQQKYDEGLVVRKGNSLYQKYFKTTAEQTRRTATTWWDDVGLISSATSKLKSLMGKATFDTPKPLELIDRMLRMITSSDENCLVLDFFSGSATTAHAVMNYNAETGGKRKYIIVQLQEAVNEKSEAFINGYRDICEIGKERIRRAAKKIAEENPEVKFDGGFRVLKCDSSNMKEVYYNPAEYEPSLFSRLEDNIKEDRTPEDLLFQVMLDLGVLLSSKIEESTIADKKVFNVDGNYLIACFDNDVTEDVIIEIAKQRPYYFVMRDSSMASDSVATNFEQIFATYSPDTVRKVL